jgi:hypothetical protein
MAAIHGQNEVAKAYSNRTSIASSAKLALQQGNCSLLNIGHAVGFITRSYQIEEVTTSTVR